MENDDKKKEISEKFNKEFQENVDKELTQINKKNQEIEKVAREILEYSCNRLLVNLRFMDSAINQFSYYAVEEFPILTDGKNIFFNPKRIIKSYSLEREVPVRNMLHIILHCIFRHMYVDDTFNSLYWDLACDIAVENTINEMDIKTLSCKREEYQRLFINELKKKVDVLTAEKIYYFLVDQKISEKKVKEIRSAFYADNHEIWYEADSIEFIKSFLINKKDLEKLQSQDEEEKENSDGGMEARWEYISERVKVEIDTFGKIQGRDFGNLSQSLQKINKEKYNYTEFLKKFAVREEALKINDEEFDYVFYTYGLSLYDNMPLVEPLEYKDVKRVKEFVIAIDTSGSTSGDLVQAFIQKTYNILKTSESFSTKINVHIIQCDAKIQEHIKITSQEEFDEYLKNMKLHGFGGTDFRPVFTFVDKLIEEKEFTNLKGMIYFTDGYGTFPSRKPACETAFVFVADENDKIPQVPSWAIKLILPPKDIMKEN